MCRDCNRGHIGSLYPTCRLPVKACSQIGLLALDLITWLMYFNLMVNNTIKDVSISKCFHPEIDLLLEIYKKLLFKLLNVCSVYSGLPFCFHNTIITHHRKQFKTRILMLSWTGDVLPIEVGAILYSGTPIYSLMRNSSCHLI